MIEVPVCIVGCGPIGIAGALLLSRFGIESIVIEKRGDVNPHPRSRFVDTNTMELMRFLGVEKEVEETGLGPDWTEYNRWFDALVKTQFAAIPSPTFHSVPRRTSPTVPVMTCQDYVENVLLGLVRGDGNIDVRYRTEAIGLTQDADGTAVTVRDLESGTETIVRSSFAIGADGPHSFVREAIGSELKAEPLSTYSQDVIFEADLSEYVGDRKGGLLYIATGGGVLVFQPLNGETRWRCQIFSPDPALLSDEETAERIRAAVGTEDRFPISITSTGMWQPTPGCVDRLRDGRVFLAGDAAHVSLPTGGMGNNIGFAGIRNLCWKMAFALNGQAPRGILDTYEIEHRPLAMDRVAAGVQITNGVARIFAAFYFGGDVEEGVRLTRQYADHDGLLLGFELESPLIAENAHPPPAVENPTMDFVPAVRSGRRAPHAWIDEGKGRSVLDWFGLEYVLLIGTSVGAGRWRAAVDRLAERTGFPIRARDLAAQTAHLYASEGLVLVRPDGIIADCWRDSDVSDDAVEARLSARLPFCRPGSETAVGGSERN